MKYSAVFPLLIACLITVHADFGDFSFLPAHDLDADQVVGHEDFNDALSPSLPRKDDKYNRLRRRSYPLQRRPVGINSRSSQLNDSSSSAIISISDSKLQEGSTTLYARSPTKDGSPGGSSQLRRTVSLSEASQRTRSLGNQGQQQALPGRRTVNVLQPLTDDTLLQWLGQYRQNHYSGPGRGIAIGPGGSSPRYQQQRQRRTRGDVMDPSSLPTTNILLSTPTGELRSGRIGQVLPELAGSPRRNSPIASLDGQPDLAAAAAGPVNPGPQVESRSTHRVNNSRSPSPSRVSPRRRRREQEASNPNLSITASERSTGDGGNRGVVNGPISASSSDEEEPSTWRRRLQRRSFVYSKQQKGPWHIIPESSLDTYHARFLRRDSGVTELANSPLLVRRGSRKKKNKSNSRSSSVSASSSSGSLQTSKSADKIQSPTDHSDQGSSRPQSQASQNTKQNSNSRPKKANAWIYGKDAKRKQAERAALAPQGDATSSSRLSPVKLSRAPGTSGQLTRASSVASFASATSNTLVDLPLVNSPSASSVGSWFSAKSDRSDSPLGSPRASLIGSPIGSISAPSRADTSGSRRTSLPGSPKIAASTSPRANLPGSPNGVQTEPPVSNANPNGNRRISISAASPRSATTRTQALLTQSIPPSPFVNTRPVEALSAPSSPSTHYRPSPFANAHSRVYSAPELVFYDSSRPSTPQTPPSPKASIASPRTNTLSEAPITQAGSDSSSPRTHALSEGPLTQAGSSFSSPARPGIPVHAGSLLLTPASAVSWRTQEPISRLPSSDSTLSEAMRAAAQPQPQRLIIPDQASSSRTENRPPSTVGSTSLSRDVSGSSIMSIEQQPSVLYQEPPPPPPRREHIESLNSHLDPVVVPPKTNRYGPIGSPALGSPRPGPVRNPYRRP